MSSILNKQFPTFGTVKDFLNRYSGGRPTFYGPGLNDQYYEERGLETPTRVAPEWMQ